MLCLISRGSVAQHGHLTSIIEKRMKCQYEATSEVYVSDSVNFLSSICVILCEPNSRHCFHCALMSQ